MCADVECQVFAGNNKRTPETDKAVEETKGLCLFYGDEVIGAYYASNCGGMSEDVENVWPIDPELSLIGVHTLIRMKN